MLKSITLKVIRLWSVGTLNITYYMNVTLTGCPPVCNIEYCTAPKRDKFFDKACSVWVICNCVQNILVLQSKHSLSTTMGKTNKFCLLTRPPDKTGGTCVITNCKVCYFDKNKRMMPPGCHDKICHEWRNRNCLSKWAHCIKDNFQRPAYPVSIDCHSILVN